VSARVSIAEAALVIAAERLVARYSRGEISAMAEQLSANGVDVEKLRDLGTDLRAPSMDGCALLDRARHDAGHARHLGPRRRR